VTRLFCIYPPGDAELPADWARARAVEGWHGLAVADHVWTDGVTSPHLWVTLGAMATATSGLADVALTSTFANGLLRSPVDVAHASLMLQAITGGRFEVGLGAGWDQAEAEAIGVCFPGAPSRVARYGEALGIVRTLFDQRGCRFAGEHHRVDIADFGLPGVDAPPLIASAGGTRTLDAVAPYVDGIEIKLPGLGARGRSLDLARMRALRPEDVASRIARVHTRAPAAEVGLTVVAAAGDDARVERLAAALAGSWYARFVGDAPTVAAAIRGLAALGADRIQVGAATPGSYPALARVLCADR
jgi:alkanesulfonate monooxygenase SsuD/methylene tetrahydromethanopterin reductase-like flavin-dependent oxidoreductase (luciferase family)